MNAEGQNQVNGDKKLRKRRRRRRGKNKIAQTSLKAKFFLGTLSYSRSWFITTKSTVYENKIKNIYINNNNNSKQN